MNIFMSVIFIFQVSGFSSVAWVKINQKLLQETQYQTGGTKKIQEINQIQSLRGSFEDFDFELMEFTEMKGQFLSYTYKIW